MEPRNQVDDLKDQVDGVKKIMTDNVERILARGERLDDLMDKSEDLQAGVSVSIKGAFLHISAQRSLFLKPLPAAPPSLNSLNNPATFCLRVCCTA